MREAIPVMVVLAQLRSDPLRIAESFFSDAARRLRREAARLEISCAHVEMKLKLVVYVGIDVRAPEAEVAAPSRRVWIVVHGSLTDRWGRA
ncbi:MAG TPA: hypothetical protein VIB98_09805 [Gemmatimonadaceae bacterium]|jgi:hypothetical protein